LGEFVNEFVLRIPQSCRRAKKMFNSGKYRGKAARL